VLAAIDARHDQVYFQVVSGDGGSLASPRIAPIDEALGASRFGAVHLVGNAAGMLADRWHADARPPSQVDALPAPDIAWVAWLGAAVNPETAAARPYYLRAPDAKPAKEMRAKAPQPSTW
jgi:tRNA threonylcarbamoyladenosine biosynthesis protein TsaB